MTLKRFVTAVSISASLVLAANPAAAFNWGGAFNNVVNTVSNPNTYVAPPIPPVVTGGISAGIGAINDTVNTIANGTKSIAATACKVAISGAASAAVGMACTSAIATITTTCAAEVAPETEGAGTVACAAIPATAANIGCGIGTAAVFTALMVDDMTNSVCDKL